MKAHLLKILITLLLIAGSTRCIATQLPKPVVDYIKTVYPKATVRFDGLVELSDDTQYLPVLPVIQENIEGNLEIIQTIPANMQFAEKPDMVLFNNNLALLKIIKKQDVPPTVISSNEMPLKVKLGILPQDLVVPQGLVLPVELKVILGDLKIPLTQKADKEGDIAFYNQKDPALQGKTTENVYAIPELAFLNKKKLFSVNHRDNKVYVLDPGTGRVMQTIALPSVPFNVVLTPDSRYILLSGAASDKIFVVDTSNNSFVKSIEAGKFPVSVVCVEKTNKAYVANKFSRSISEIDLENMQLVRHIDVNGNPDNLALSENQEYLYFNDYKTGSVLRLHPASGDVIYLYSDANISKLARVGKYLYSISRTENTLTSYHIIKRNLEKIELGMKPLDFEIQKDKMFVVSAGSRELHVINLNEFKLINTLTLANSSFPGKIELVGSKAIITDYDTYEIVIYDINSGEVGPYVPVNNIVGSMLIAD